MVLTLANVLFEENMKTRDTAFFFDDEDGKFSISFDIDYLSNQVEEEEWCPRLCINWFEVGTRDLFKLVGRSFSCENIQKSMEREDSFYLYEHEPFVEYRFTILAVENKKIHIEGSGTIVRDGYADPYTTAHFALNGWLPVITCAKDWDRLGI